jgi:hypothetical protein
LASPTTVLSRVPSATGVVEAINQRGALPCQS